MDLSKLNSATKYPSIPTYHALGPKGAVTDTVQVPFVGRVIAREKIDGTNARIVFLPGGDYVIGSREELLHARGDRIWNPSMGIVDHLRPIADRIAPRTAPTLIGRDVAVVLYGELYGGKVTAASKCYTSTGAVAFRAFDLAFAPLDVLAREPREIAAWRDGGGQRFMGEDDLRAFCAEEGAEMAPLLWEGDASEIGRAPALAELFIDNLVGAGTKAGIDHGGAAEGVIVRTPDRKLIAKLRVEDYARARRGSK